MSRFQFDLKRLLLGVVCVALMLGALAGLVRPGPEWRLADGLTSHLARGTFGEDAELAKPIGEVRQVMRDPGEVKVYLIVAVFGPLGMVVLFSLIGKAKKWWQRLGRRPGW